MGGRRPQVVASLPALLARLVSHYGPQGWWPAEHAFEMAVGAVLVQNAAWTNAERAIARMRQQGLLSPGAVADLGEEQLAPIIRSSGTYRVKARRLKSLASWWLEAVGKEGNVGRPVRRALRAVHGIGPETADCIAVYAFQEPAFIADAYARRLLTRLGIVPANSDYESVQRMIEPLLPADAGFHNEAHAAIVAHGKHACRARPSCTRCFLREQCAFGQRTRCATSSVASAT